MVSFSKKQILAIAFVLLVLSVGTYIRLHEKTLPTPVVITEKIKVTEQVKQPVSKVIGTSTEGRTIKIYTYGNGATRLTFVGGIHGGYEWNSVLLAYTFMDYLDSHPEFIPKNLTIDVIPSVNPDGLHRVTGKDGRFTIADVATDATILASGRFNANEVDLNRNFDCKWKATSTWQSKLVRAGTAAFSEPEVKAIQNFMVEHRPSAVIFWHSKSNAVYASQCEKGILPETLAIMNIYSEASGYKAVKTFDSYATTGAADDWLSSINIPAITVELTTHEKIDWEQNISGIKSLIKYYSK